MGFPGEEMAAAAIEKIADGVIHKMDAAEERRNREFSLKLKELEFYKGNYDKEIKSIFDRWFNILQYSLLAGNKHLDEKTQNGYQKKVDGMLTPDKAFQLKIDTMKYGGTETGKALAVFSQMTFRAKPGDEQSKYANMYAVCFLLATLKKEILGQNIDPGTVLNILICDYEEHAEVIKKAQKNFEDMYNSMFSETNN